MRVKIIAAAFALVPILCAAEEGWDFYASGNDGSKHHWKLTSAKKSGENWVSWVKSTPSKPQPIDETKPNGKKYSYSVGRRLFNCKERTMATLSIHEYDAKGTVVASVDNSQYPTLKPALPDSVGEAFLNEACSILEP